MLHTAQVRAGTPFPIAGKFKGYKGVDRVTGIFYVLTTAPLRRSRERYPNFTLHGGFVTKTSCFGVGF